MYALVGSQTNELLTYHGHIIVHDNKDELSWLVPGYRIVALPQAEMGLPLIQLRDHPDMASVRWPLNKKDFWASV